MDESFDLTSLQVMATQLHEMFEAWMHAGFTPEQAFTLVQVYLIEMIRKP